MEPSDCNIKVFCRFRPQNEFELKNGGTEIVNFATNEIISIDNKNFTFDSTFPPETDQLQIYESAAKPLVGDLLSGYNSTIFAYGQTSSGKTYTMEGIFDDMSKLGIIPRIIDDIFKYIYQMDENLEFHIKVAYFEIYLDSIKDLLDSNNRNLSVHQDKHGNPFVKGITERFVSCSEEMYDIIEEAKSNRHIACTNMNEHSSRSHSIFLINLRQQNTLTKKSKVGKLFLVDLAGSEKVSKTGASGVVLDEAKNINKSLGALGNVISALAENKAHVPYRDSKLTRILQESLGGNSRTTIIICCSISSINTSETISTLRFGQRAITITNKVSINEELSSDEWRIKFEREQKKTLKYKKYSHKLEGELEQWRTGCSVSLEKQVDINSTECLETEVRELKSVSPKKIKLCDPPDILFTENSEIKEQIIVEQRKKIDELQTENMKYKNIIYDLNFQLKKFQCELESREQDKRELIKALSDLAVHYEKESQQYLEINNKYNTINADLESTKNKNILKSKEINALNHQISTSEEKFKNDMFGIISSINDLTNMIGILPDSSNSD
ncbi:hypothetical protein MXB_1177, partial [Myxobolus squamalis]